MRKPAHGSVRARLTLAAAVVIAAGCRPPVPAEPPGETPTPDPAPDPVPAEVEVADTPPAESEPSPAAMPARFASLGSSCASVADEVTAYCDDDGNAVGLSAPVDLVPDIPWQRIHVEFERTGLERGGSLTVGFVGEQLWVHHVACGICRRIVGTAIVAELDRLSDAQRSKIQDLAGLPAEPVLRTPEDWLRTLAPE